MKLVHYITRHQASNTHISSESTGVYCAQFHGYDFCRKPYARDLKATSSLILNILFVCLFVLSFFFSGKPKVSLSFGPFYVEKDENVTLLVCHVTSFPLAVITWAKVQDTLSQTSAVRIKAISHKCSEERFGFVQMKSDKSLRRRFGRYNILYNSSPGFQYSHQWRKHLSTVTQKLFSFIIYS